MSRSPQQSRPDLSDRYGRASISVKILWSLVALAMVVLGAIWTFAGSGTAQTFGPVIGGLGVALGYVVLVQRRH